MSRNNSKNAASRRSKNQSDGEKSSRPAFLAGLFIGALIMYFLPTLLATNPNLKSDGVSDIVNKANVQELQFDFYELLKDNEILVPETESIDADNEKLGKDYQYILQVGSFKSSDEAENLKVSLLLMNLAAESESIKNKNGETWHRVLVGPFANTSKMASARAKLAQNSIESLMLKREL